MLSSSFPRSPHRPGAALSRGRLPVAAIGLSVAGHLAVGAAVLALVLWTDGSAPRVHVVNLVPTVAAIGTPVGRPAPPAPVPPAPQTPAPDPPEPRPAPAPPRPVPEPPPRPREALALPAAPARSAQLPPRPPALPRAGERELPPIASAARPTPPPATEPQRPAEAPPAAPAPVGQVTGSTAGSGALTLDVSDFPHAWYLRQVLRKVEEQWQRQGLTQEPAQKPMVVVEIQRNGTIPMPRVEKTSGNAFYDQAALRAIMDASPFPELPRDWPKPVLRVMFRFDLKQG
jgi:TonB family protein